MRLIGLTGFARSGKDHLARAIGWKRAAFADALKRDVAGMLGLTMEGLEGLKQKLRPLLVEYGKAQRLIDPDYWVKRIQFDPEADTVITDVRYINEARWVKERGGIVVYVNRPGIEPANDEEANSIHELLAHTYHHGVTNEGEGGIERLREIVIEEFGAVAQ